MSSPVSVHQSVKKAGVREPAPPPRPPGRTHHHMSVDSGSDESADDEIEQSVEQPSIVGASLVVASLIIVPLSVALIITVCARLYRQGKLPFTSNRRHSHRLNLGNLLSHSRNGVGFHKLTTLDRSDFHDELDPLRSDDSEIEEFSTIDIHHRPA